jgi:hypothetical protein
MKLILIDNQLYRKLIQTNNEHINDLFYDSLDPEYRSNLFKLVFTPFSLLEALGIGKRIKREILNQLLKPTIETQEQAIQAPSIIYDAALKFCMQHKELQPKYLIKKIKKQITNFSANKAMLTLVKSTLGLWKKRLKKKPNNNLIIIQALAWNITCCFPYFELPNMTVSERKTIEEHVEILHSALITLWYKQRKKHELSLYSIIDRASYAHSFTELYQKDIKLSIGANRLDSIEISAALDPKEDLLDSDIISHLILGKYDIRQKNYCSVDVFTNDSKNIISDRIILCYLYIKKIEKELPIVPGTIYFVDNNCKVLEKLNVDTLFNQTCISLRITHN